MCLPVEAYPSFSERGQACSTLQLSLCVQRARSKESDTREAHCLETPAHIQDQGPCVGPTVFPERYVEVLAYGHL